MNYRKYVEKGARLLKESGVPDAELDAWYLLEFCLKKQGIAADRTWFLLHREEEISEKEALAYEELLKIRAKRIPLQQITGEQEFMGFPFLVNEHVLIPRQDTEVLVEEGMNYAVAGNRVLDLCTGSGCILISLMKLVPGLTGVGVDISPKALEVAEKNAKALGIEAVFLKSDLFEAVEGTFDLILSNPPYIPTEVLKDLMEEVRDYEPVGALDGKEDGLFFYRKIVRESLEFLRPGGRLLFEIGFDQGEAVTALMEQAGFTEIRILKDLSGRNRVVEGRR